MHPLLRYTKANKEEIVATVRQMVECESPTDSPADVNRYVELLIQHSKDIATPKLIKSDKYGNHLRLEFKAPGKAREGRILGIGHSDTVWPLGTLRSMPYRRRKGRLWGPGVLDMKAGIAFFVYAARALRDLDIPARRKIDLLIVSDEEVGSKESRAVTELEAKRSNCVLVLEPGSPPVGALKTARKGIAGYRLTVHGKAAHAGVDFTSGASAIVEIARQIDRIARFTDLRRGTTVNPGVIGGGTRTNVTAAEAHVDIDVRVTRVAEAAIVDRRMRSLRPFDNRCKLTIEGGLNRPPMERTKSIVTLFSRAKHIGAGMGMQLEESSTGGGSDGNFTAALGIPTLDGLGAVGNGAHAIDESILIERIPDRTALLAGLLAGL
jgi:glutamate carboxypeptidase